jgi:hypothetical protein
MNAKDARLLGTQDHRTLAILAADCTEDVLAYFFRGHLRPVVFPGRHTN